MVSANAIPVPMPKNILTNSSSTAPGTVSTVAGSYLSTTAPANGDTATSVSVYSPYGMVVDGSGDVIIANYVNDYIYFVAASNCSSSCPFQVSATTPETKGDIYIIGGTGTSGYNGDSQAGTSADFHGPVAITLDSSGDAIIADDLNSEVRLIAKSSCSLTCPFGLASMTAGYVYQLYRDTTNCSSYGIHPDGVTVDSSGKLYFGDGITNAIYEFTTVGSTPTVVAGTGSSCNSPGFGGDSGAATSATLNLGYKSIGLRIDSYSNLIFTDSYNNRIRMVASSTCSSNCAYGLPSTSANDIYTIAGNGTGCTSSDSYTCGEAGSPTSAELNDPDGLSLDASGEVYVSDGGDGRIWKFAPNGGVALTVANSDGVSGFNGDGNIAQQTELNVPAYSTIDSSGNLYVADEGNSLVREVYGVAIAGSLTTGVGPTSTDLLGANMGQCAGDPVNCNTGNYYSTSTDVNIPFRDLPLNVTRTYNSLSAVNCSSSAPGQFGCGNSSVLGDSITFSGGGASSYQVATITTEAGATVDFTCSTTGSTCSGTWDPPAWDPSDSLSYVSASSTYQFQDKGNLTYIFTDITSGQTFGANSSLGVISGIKDLNG